MQSNDRSIQQNDLNAVSSSLRTQRILEHLEQQVRRSHEPSHENFKRIIESILTIPEAYRAIGLTTIAEHFVNGMEMHLLELVATFEEKAEKEGISTREYQATLQDVLPEAFQTLAALRKQLTIASLDELAALNNITIRLYTLSISETATEAQQWLYELPATYLRQLHQAGLLTGTRYQTGENQSQTIAPTTHFTDWQTSYMSTGNSTVQEIGTTGVGVTMSSGSVPKPVPTPVETSNPKLVSAA